MSCNCVIFHSLHTLQRSKKLFSPVFCFFFFFNGMCIFIHKNSIFMRFGSSWVIRCSTWFFGSVKTRWWHILRHSILSRWIGAYTHRHKMASEIHHRTIRLRYSLLYDFNTRCWVYYVFIWDIGGYGTQHRPHIFENKNIFRTKKVASFSIRFTLHMTGYIVRCIRRRSIVSWLVTVFVVVVAVDRVCSRSQFYTNLTQTAGQECDR